MQTCARRLAFLSFQTPKPFPRLVPRIAGSARSVVTIHHDRFQPPPPPTPWQKVWYRADGKPRSKTKGALLAALTIGTGMVMYELALHVLEAEEFVQALAILVHVQNIEQEHPSTSDKPDEYAELVRYFKALYVRLVSDESMNFVVDLLEHMDEPAQSEFRRQLLRLRRRIRKALKECPGREPETAIHVRDIVNHALFRVVEAVEEILDDEVVAEIRKRGFPSGKTLAFGDEGRHEPDESDEEDDDY